MFKKETTDKKYHEDPFRAVNFPIGEGGIMRCPNGKSFLSSVSKKRKKGTSMGVRKKCISVKIAPAVHMQNNVKETDKNRTVRINRELTAMHQEVIENLESIQGALLDEQIHSGRRYLGIMKTTGGTKELSEEE